MAKLSDEELATLKRLREKEKAPDGPGPAINFSLNLGDDRAYERAVKLGLITEPDSGNGDSDGDDDDSDADDVPGNRRSYFGS